MNSQCLKEAGALEPKQRLYKAIADGLHERLSLERLGCIHQGELTEL
jgi:hypothetical protein